MAEEKMEEKIKTYPTNWLYNAGVIGFLKVIAFSKGESWIERWLNDDGTVEIEREIFKNSLDFYKKFHKEKEEKELPLIGKNIYYPNYLQKNEEKAFAEYVVNLVNIKENGSPCGFCTQGFCFDSIANFSNEAQKIYKRIGLKLQVVHNSFLAPSIYKFPNAFWNLNTSLSVCPLCAYLIIHHHISFVDAYVEIDSEEERENRQQIFINAPSFKIMWYLNKFSEKLFKSKEQYNLRKILGISLMELSQKIYISFGAWSIMNIEMVIKKYDSIDYYSLPYEISLILLQKDIASLISQTQEPYILELILDGKFDVLLNLSRKVLRYITTRENIDNDKLLTNLKNRDFSSFRNLSNILPELYVKINSILNKEMMV